MLDNGYEVRKCLERFGLLCLSPEPEDKGRAQDLLFDRVGAKRPILCVWG